MQEAESQGPYTDHCLDCRIEQRQIAIPLDFVDQLLQYDRRPLPLSAAHVGGLGIYEGRLVISICLKLKPERRSISTKAVLLRGAPGGTPWALEVDETLSFVDVIRHQGASHSTGEPWLTPANSLDGQAFEWLDVERLTSSLAIHWAT
jgi:hypothetical protein